ncbi:putative Ig domain-containing protein, partial [candidate division KSB1 bacterium]
KLILDTSGTDKVVAITDSIGVWRNDNGAFLPTWTRLSTGLTDSVMYDLAVDPQNANVLYTSSRGGVFKSTNQGTSWAPVNSGLASDSTSINVLAVSTVNPSIVFAVSSAGKVYRTENAGNTWTYRGAVSGSPSVTSGFVHPQYNGVLYIGSNGNYVYKSDDAGATFTQISTGLLDNRVLSLAIDTTGTDRLFAGTDSRGVHKLESPYTTWTPITSGLENGVVLSLDVYKATPHLIYAGTEVRGFYRYLENRLPVISPISDQRVVAGETIQFTVTAADPDSGETQDLHFNVIGLPTGATFDSIGTRVFSWTPDTSQAGYDTVIFKVNDERDGFAYDTVSINVNIRPLIAAIADTTMAEDSLFSVILTVTDADGDVPTVTTSTVLPPGLTTTLPTGATYNDGTRTFTWTPGYSQAGIYTITFTADDGRGATYSESFQIIVTDVNQLPYFSPALTTQTISEGQILNLTLSAVDNDGDAITYGTSGGIPAGAHYDSTDTRAFSWIPGYDQAGTHNIALTLDDGKGAIVTDTLSITVTDVNRGPSIQDITTPQYVNVGDSMQFNVVAVDADSTDTLSISVLGRPLGATFVSTGSNQKTFTWVPSVNQNGTFEVTFHVQDQSGAVDHQNVTIIVNRTPALSGPGAQSVNEGDTLSFVVRGTDADGDSLTFSVSDRPSGSTITNSGDSVRFLWYTGYSDAGSYSVEFTADDGSGGTSSVSVNILVNNVNRAPVLETIGSKTAYIGSELSFYISGTDSDNDNLTYSTVNLKITV